MLLGALSSCFTSGVFFSSSIVFFSSTGELSFWKNGLTSSVSLLSTVSGEASGNFKSMTGDVVSSLKKGLLLFSDGDVSVVSFYDCSFNDSSSILSSWFIKKGLLSSRVSSLISFLFSSLMKNGFGDDSSEVGY